MRVEEFVGRLDREVQIHFTDRNGKEICSCKSMSEGVIPYKDRGIIGWSVGDFSYNTDRCQWVTIRLEELF